MGQASLPYSHGRSEVELVASVEYFAFSPAHAAVDTARAMPSAAIAATGMNTGDGIFLTSRARIVHVTAASNAHANEAPGAKVQTDR